ncbi:hypothetical protein STFE110948_01030 [Streptobacillus felis]|uniref:Uncharacterized protein n=1 Tax=Streptobacillus felis TaxID=1384509 RepID=A0A7Z0PEF2_9FUSO|nr:hypothetical protein [Streptobacillus felis]NYV27748.1 hypothetical protein [Streptobacillus felis]
MIEIPERVKEIIKDFTEEEKQLVFSKESEEEMFAEVAKIAEKYWNKTKCVHLIK